MSTGVAACSNLAMNISLGNTQTVYGLYVQTAGNVDRLFTDTSLSSQYVCTSGQYLAYTDSGYHAAYSVYVINGNSDLNPATSTLC